MDNDAKQKIAYFKFSLIAPLINENYTQETAKEYMEVITSKVYDVPSLGKREFSPNTIKTWLYCYRKYGFEGLYPKSRCDKGASRVLTDDVKAYIKNLKLDNPRRSAKSIYHELLVKKFIKLDKVSLSTVQRYLRKTKISTSTLNTKDRRAFEMEYPNDCWQSDISMGPYLIINDKKIKTYLIAFLDDSSRLITHAEFYDTDNVISLIDAFKKAISKRGVPKKLFVDNGKVFQSEQLHLICASLGTSLCYAEPYSPESKGKIERFFRTLKDQWMYGFDWQKISSIDELNENLNKYIEGIYHQTVHSSINMKPIEKFIKYTDTMKFINSKEELDNIFLYRVKRRVIKDATVSIEKIKFEVPMQYIGDYVNIRYYPKSLDKAYIFSEEGKLLQTIHPVNKIDNSKIKRKEIDFSL
ncbi:DDE-type integrase/transposase/recombinase [Thermoanaerobacterium thermosaccharolyticum]|uniref:DDE-type integrase/transposase/recombinase n=1 Tax=Thermoanaerobacterium thermosaccharolyticum TaxID=1517 RepID=UPI003DA9A685